MSVENFVILLAVLMISLNVMADPTESSKKLPTEKIVEAPPAETIQTFTEWKGTQVLAAQNKVVRISNCLHLHLTNRLPRGAEGRHVSPCRAGSTSETKAGASDRPESFADMGLRLKRELRTAQSALEFHKNSTISDYAENYLVQFKDQAEVLKGLAGRHTKEEFANLLRVILAKVDQSHQGASRTRARLRTQIQSLSALGDEVSEKPNKIN